MELDLLPLNLPSDNERPVVMDPVRPRLKSK